MKYLVRSFKSLLWIVSIFAIMVLILILVNDQMSFDNLFQEGGMFKEGSGWKLIAFFVLASAVYPALSYVKKETFVYGTFESNRDKIIEVFTRMEYVLVREDSETATFRKAKALTRFMRQYEDAVTITKGESPLILSGIRKDIVRLASGIEYATRNPEEE